MASEVVAWLYEHNGKADVSVHRFRTLPATFVETPLIRAGTRKVTDADVYRAESAYFVALKGSAVGSTYVEATANAMRAALESFVAMG